MTYNDFLKKSLIPLVVIHAIISLVAAGFFLDVGVWRPLWPTVIALSFSFLVFPFLLFPTAFFSGAMQLLETAYPKVSKVMMVCSLGYMILIMVLFAMIAFFAMGDFFEHATFKWIAYFWCASSSVLIWAVFGLRDRDGTLFITLVWFYQVAVYAAGYVSFVQGERLLLQFFGVAYAIMALMLFVQHMIEQKIHQKKISS